MNLVLRLSGMDVHKRNRRTLAAYEKRAQDYIQKTPATYTIHHTPLLNWINASLAMLPPGSKILEIGSATAREARYMRSKGFKVVCSDAARAFVKNLRCQGEEAFMLDAIEDPIPTGYDMIFANAVVPHFTPDDLQTVLEKIYQALPTGGLFCFSAKLGTGDAWITEKFTDKRYIHFWQPDDLEKLVCDAGFDIPFVKSGTTGDIPTHKWINLTAQKSF